MGTSLCESFAIDLACQIVNKCPLEYRAAYRCHLMFSVRVQVVTNTVTLSTIVDVLPSHRQLEGLHEKGSSHHVIIVKCSPAGVAVLMPQFTFGMQQGRVFCQVLTVHNQVLPVHIDLDAGGIYAQAASAGDAVKGCRNIAPKDAHLRVP